jgi:hypothetical protein
MKKENEDQATGFAKFIQDYQGGRLNDVLRMELMKVVEASQRHKAAASLTIQINLKGGNENESEMLVKWSKKVPQKDSMKAIMYVDKDLQLVGDNPAQGKLFEQKTVLMDSETGQVINREFNQ